MGGVCVCGWTVWGVDGRCGCVWMGVCGWAVCVVGGYVGICIA